MVVCVRVYRKTRRSQHYSHSQYQRSKLLVCRCPVVSKMCQATRQRVNQQRTMSSSSKWIGRGWRGRAARRSNKNKQQKRHLYCCRLNVQLAWRFCIDCDSGFSNWWWL
uniref:(northern house mosquito) hypothetical protein n=1 Tax=Culex pipiens TaxID=7175 RepID=A0A8D8JIZ3_CULPI